MKPAGTGSPNAQYEVVAWAEVAMLMPAMMLPPHVQYVCIPVTPNELPRGPSLVVVNLQSLVSVGLRVEVGDMVVFLLADAPVGEMPVE